MPNEITKDRSIMLLDVGNTNLKWLRLIGDSKSSIVSVSHKGRLIPDLADEQWGQLTPPTMCYIANVAGKDIEQGLREWISENWEHEPVIVHSLKNGCGVTNSYSEPERLGVDRWLTLIALRCRIPGPICVVDCGTAVTIDAMNSNGQHLGGLILPGFGLMHQALRLNTAIPIRGEADTGQFLATDTESAISNGGVNAVAALVEKVQKQVSESGEKNTAVVLTGSDARILQSAISIDVEIESDLVMQGLMELVNNSSEGEL